MSLICVVLAATACLAYREPTLEPVHHVIPLAILPVGVAMLGMVLLVRGQLLGRIVVAVLLGLGAFWFTIACCYAVFALAVPISAIPSPIAWNGVLVALFLVAAFSRRLTAELRSIRSDGWWHLIGRRGSTGCEAGPG